MFVSKWHVIGRVNCFADKKPIVCGQLRIYLFYSLTQQIQLILVYQLLLESKKVDVGYPLHADRRSR